MSGQEIYNVAIEVVESEPEDSGHEGVPEELPLPAAIKDTIEKSQGRPSPQ